MRSGEYDIIIAGGGPAGLTVAGELAATFRVAIIEKNEPGHTSATWYSYADRAEKYGLNDAVVFRTKHIRFVAPSVTHYMKDDCVVFDHQKVMQILLDRAVGNGAVIIKDIFEDYEYTDDRVIVKTEGGTYRAKLLIDATGMQSPILKKHGLVKRKDAWVIYGGRFKNAPEKFTAELEYYPVNDDENTYVGVHPLKDGEASVYLFRGKVDTFGNPGELKDMFAEFATNNLPGAEMVETLQGTIVSGTLKKYALDRIVFFGSSGMLNPDACGMGFNEILMKHRQFADGITKAMRENLLDSRSLENIALGLRDRETINFQRIIGAFSLSFIQSNSKWDGGVKWLNAMGEDSKNWMRNEMDIEWIKRATIKLHKVIPLSETMKMIPYQELTFILSQLVRFAYNSNLIINEKHKRVINRLLQKAD